MRIRSVLLATAMAVIAVVSAALLAAAPASAASAQPTLVPTFSSVSVYWSPGGGGGTAAQVRYRPEGSGSWKQGADLSFDGRALGGQPAGYRGSIVGLDAGTTYEVRLGLAGAPASTTQRVTTWSDDFPIGEVVHLPARSTEPVTIRRTGSSDGYVLVTGPGGGPATIDVHGRADHDLLITDSRYVIVRGLTLKGARHHGVQLGTSTTDDVHDVVLEGNAISGWGTKDASGFGTPMDSAVYSASAKLTRLVVQGNRMSSPSTTANSWAQTHNGSHHPAGPQGITLLRSAGNNVIRDNDIVGDATHHFNDGMGATANFSYRGFPGPDSDISGNYIAYTWDDGVEAEGGGMNVRVSSNYLTEVYHAFGMASVSLGPLYAYRNVQDVSRSAAGASYGQAMFKMGGHAYGSTFYGDGRTYLFHNTALRPSSGPQNRQFIEAGHGRVLRNAVSRDNIMRTGGGSGTTSIADGGRSATNSFDYDLYNGSLRTAPGAESHGIRATPQHVAVRAMDVATHQGSFASADGAPGVDRGTRIPGFDDEYTGAAPDMGAQEAGSKPVVYGAAASSAGRAALG